MGVEHHHISSSVNHHCFISPEFLGFPSASPSQGVGAGSFKSGPNFRLHHSFVCQSKIQHALLFTRAKPSCLMPPFPSSTSSRFCGAPSDPAFDPSLGRLLAPSIHLVVFLPPILSWLSTFLLLKGSFPLRAWTVEPYTQYYTTRTKL